MRWLKGGRWWVILLFTVFLILAYLAGTVHVKLQPCVQTWRIWVNDDTGWRATDRVFTIPQECEAKAYSYNMKTGSTDFSCRKD